MSKSNERMDPFLSVFNSHINHAAERANVEFVAQFGQKAYDEHIARLWSTGIMAIFNQPPTPETMAWVALVTAYVNENREPKA